LYGYKLFKLFIGLIGFLGGSVVGFSLSFVAGEALITSLLCGIIGAFLFYALYRIGLFLTGFAFGGVLSLIFAIGISGDVAIASFLAGGILGGMLALQLEKLIVIILSSCKGAVLVLGGSALLVFPEQQTQLIDTVSSNPEALISLILNYFLLLLIVALVGIFYQYELIPNRVDGYMPDFLKRSFFKNQKSEERENSEPIHRHLNTNHVYSNTSREIADDKDWESSIFPKEKSAAKYPFASSKSEELNISWDSGFTAKSHSNADELHTATPEIITKAIESKYKSQPNMSTNPDMEMNKSGILELAVRPYVQFYKYITGSIFKSKKQETKLFPLIGLIRSGPQTGQQFKIQGVFNGKYYSATIGRGDYSLPNHVKLSDPSAHISRRHAEIAMKEQDFYIRNISVANPIYLNNIKVEQDAFTRLRGGDVISLADLNIEIYFTNKHWISDENPSFVLNSNYK